MTTDPVLRDRLRLAVDPLEVNVEARLDAVHRRSATHIRHRRVSAAVGVAVVMLAAALAVAQLRGGTATIPGAGPEPIGTIAYSPDVRVSAELTVRRSSTIFASPIFTRGRAFSVDFAGRGLISSKPLSCLGGK